MRKWRYRRVKWLVQKSHFQQIPAFSSALLASKLSFLHNDCGKMKFPKQKMQGGFCSHPSFTCIRAAIYLVENILVSAHQDGRWGPGWSGFYPTAGHRAPRQTETFRLQGWAMRLLPRHLSALYQTLIMDSTLHAEEWDFLKWNLVF